MDCRAKKFWRHRQCEAPGSEPGCAVLAAPVTPSKAPPTRPPSPAASSDMVEVAMEPDTNLIIVPKPKKRPKVRAASLPPLPVVPESRGSDASQGSAEPQRSGLT